VFLAAVVQMRSGNDRAANEARALELLGEAAGRGALLIGLPEMWEHIGPAREKHSFAGPVDGPQLARIRELCSNRAVWCLAGSIAELAPQPQGGSVGSGRIYNTTALISPRGEIVAAYRKLHLFDVDIPDGARYRESEQVAPGDARPRAIESSLGVKIGLSVCYDLRFPELYREMGGDLLCVPAAFTAYTGKAHWEVLLRARAIENQAFVLAPAQVGRIGPANENRFAWGHACIIDPWGEVLADAGGENEGVAVAAIHPERLSQVRRDLPALQHRRRDVV
jgi:deaminated glutathione amidase